MNFTADSRPLRALVDAAARQAPSRTTIPILQSVLLRADAGGLTVAATDLDRWAEGRLDAGPDLDVAAAGAVAVDVARLAAILAATPEGGQTRIALAGDGGAAIDAGDRSWRLAALPAEDFPAPLAAPADAARFTLPAESARRWLEFAAVAVSAEEARHYLCGVYIQCAEGRLFGVGTDGHRLSAASIPAPDGADVLPAAGVILPRETVTGLLRLLRGAADEVEIAIGDAVAEFDLGPARLATKLIDGTFPDWRRVVPAADGTRPLTLDRAALRDAAAAAAPCTRTFEKARGRRAALDLAPGEALLTAEDGAGDRARVPLEAEWDGPAALIGFNLDYLRALTDWPGADRLTLGLDTRDPASSPIRITDPDDADDFTAVRVLMPMRV